MFPTEFGKLGIFCGRVDKNRVPCSSFSHPFIENGAESLDDPYCFTASTYRSQAASLQVSSSGSHGEVCKQPLSSYPLGAFPQGVWAASERPQILTP